MDMWLLFLLISPYILKVIADESTMYGRERIYKVRKVVSSSFIDKCMIPLTWFLYRKSYSKFYRADRLEQMIVRLAPHDNVDVVFANGYYWLEVFFIDKKEEVKFNIEFSGHLVEVNREII